MLATGRDPIRISIVEDDERELLALSGLLSRSHGFRVVGAHQRPESAWSVLRSERPDLILLDLVFPDTDLSGHDFLLRLRAEADSPKVVVWTVHDDEGHFLSALKAGACGYLLKTTPLEQLPDALRAIYHGELRISAGVARLMLRELMAPASRGRAQSDHRLTEREETTLQLIANGFSQSEIAAKLGLSLRTVEHHLASARQKLAARTTAQAVCRYQGSS